MHTLSAGGDNSDGQSHYNKSNTLNGNNGNKANQNRICKDFVRGNCRRKRCRYPHVVSSELVVFCHDFQNTSCNRSNCKFLHYTVHEEEYYRTHGEFPTEPRSPSLTGSDESMLPCKDHIIFGRCRHKDCYILDGYPSQLISHKLSHVPESQNTRSTERHQRLSAIWKNSGAMGSCDYPDSLRSPLISGFRSERESDDFQSLKRSGVPDSSSPPPYKRYRDELDRIDVLAIIRRFEEEQIMLRRRVEANEIKIAELRASNEYLLAQNAQLRLTNVQCSAVVNPVTVTQTSSQPQTQLIGGVSIAPVQMQATPIVSIATPQTQIIASSATPLAIAANTSQGQQLAISQQNITSLSNTTQQLGPAHAQQILGTSQITLTPALAQGLTINTSQALAMSNATQPIISYPIMTHSILPH